MVMETYDVSQFLNMHPLLGEMTEATKEHLLHKMQIAYTRAGRSIEFEGKQIPGLMMLRSGSIEIRDKSGTLKDQLSAGDVIAICLLYKDGVADYTIHALEDSLYYLLDRETFKETREKEDILQNLYSVGHRRYRAEKETKAQEITETVQPPKPADALGSLIPQWRQFNPSPLAMSQVAEYMKSPIIGISMDKTIEDGAKIMSREKISALVVLDGKTGIGIVTDKDLRNRVLAAGISPTENIQKIMTPEPIGISSNATLHEAQLLMMAHEIHHLIISKNDKPVGMITSSDILKASNLEPLPLLSRIKKAETRETLIKVSSFLPELVSKLTERNTRPSEVGQIITAFSDSLTRRLIKMAIAKYGDPPCAYTWLAFGSQARQEQMIGSDQDNALITEHKLSVKEEKYFEKFTRFVNEGLHECGFVYCPGEIMAGNPKWRMGLEDWLACFDKWIEQPEPLALMHASIFFDMRGIAGDMSLKETLQQNVLKKAQANTIFLAYMSSNALQHRPPLGFFKNFVLDLNGEHANELDLKKRGTIPIVDIARNYALANGLSAVNTIDRLRAMRENKIMSVDLANSLIDAHEFIARVRLKAQAKEHRIQAQIDNYINPKSLSPLQRQQLKEAFQCVRESQQIMSNRFNATI